MTSGDLSERAAHLIDLGRADEAVELLGRHLAAYPEDAYALCQLSRAELRRNDITAAARSAEAAVRAAPDDEWGYRLGSIAALHRDDAANAVALAQEAVRLDPELWLTHYTLSRALVAADRLWDAQQEARWAVQLAPLEAEAHLQLAVAADARRSHKEADAALARALELDPQDPDALNFRAARELESHRLGRAARTMMGALRLDPQSASGHENLSSLMSALLLRLYVVTAISGLVVGVLLALGREGEIASYWPRALAGFGFLLLVALVGWLTLRHVPRATRGHLLQLPRTWRGTQLIAPAFFGLAAVCLVAMAFLPAAAASAGGVLLITLIRLGQIAFLVWLGLAAVRGVRHAVSRARAKDRR